MLESTIDEKGRIVIPRELLISLGLQKGSKVKLALNEKRIVITRPINPKEFIREMEGFIKKNSPIPKIDPLKLKKIWEQQL